MNIEQQFYDVLPSIAAENAALRVKVRQEYDVNSVIRNDIQKADLYIESFKRDNERYDELLEAKAQEFTKLEEELNNLSLSREHIQSNTDNLKKQHELISIEDEQRRKEQDLVRSNYETMIRNRREIFNSNRLVVRRNNLKNRCENARIQISVMEERLIELERQMRQFREIQNMNLKSVSIELADVWVNNKKENEKMIVLRNKLQEKQDLLTQLSSVKGKVTPTQRSPRSQLVSLPLPTPSPPIRIPPLKNNEENDLTKYFQKINLFKKGRSPFLLPPVLSRAPFRKEKESFGFPKASSTLIDSPANKITSSVSDNVKNSEVEKTVSDPPKIIDTPEPTTQKMAFQPINIPQETDPKNIEPEIISINEKPNQMYSLLENDVSRTDSPGKIKSNRLMDKRVSPLTVSRMSPLNVSHKSPKSSSRIPVPVSSSSPIRTTSRIPVRFTPLKTNQKRDQDKENVHRPELPKRVAITPKNLDDEMCKSKQSQGAKRLDVSSPKRGIKYPKMDYAFMQGVQKTHKIFPEDDSVEVPLMQVDQLDNQINKKNLYKNDINFEYDEVFNENNPMIRSYAERLKVLREGNVKKDPRKEKYESDDIEKTKKLLKNKKSDFLERELFEVNDSRHLFKNIDISKEKYSEFAKRYEKFQPHDIRKDEQIEPKDCRDVEKPESEFSLKEAVSRIEKKEDTLKKQPEKLDIPEVNYIEYECEDTFHPNADLYLDGDEKLSKSSGVSNGNRNRSEVFSPFSNGYSISPPGSNNFSTPFVPMGERGSMFSFGSSVNQLFGSTDGTNGQSKNQNNGFFGFNFSSSVDKTDEPFKLF